MEKQQLFTPWGRQLDGDHVLQEYPRPQMERQSYLSLNGKWDYRILNIDGKEIRSGQILVPFSPESALSGVGRILMPDETLIYERVVRLPQDFKRGVTYIHFGAIDQTSKIYIDGKLVKENVGGYYPIDVALPDAAIGDSFELRVEVRDLTDTYSHQVGKQKLHPKGIFYTPQSGIWQPVWLESVPAIHIEKMKITPLWDQQAFRFEINKVPGAIIDASISFKGQLEGHIQTISDNYLIAVDHRHPWSPETPILYNIDIKYGQDEIHGYGAMRSYAINKDKAGCARFHLNGFPYLMLGVLDQGYWPDGLMTAPSDAAFVYDIGLMKIMGFNTIRKHIKIEPLRFYHHCDKMGMIVWQDMINGGHSRSIVPNGALALAGMHLNDHLHRWFGRDADSMRQYNRELAAMIEHLYSVPSIAVWTPFNEAWGQFDSVKTTKMIMAKDPTRLVDHASGWSDQGYGHFYSRHIYFSKIRFSRLRAKRRIAALTEFGGYAYKTPGHVYDDGKVFGYRMLSSVEELHDNLKKLWLGQLLPQLDNGLQAMIYTQLSDVENEVNGLVSYDRDQVKIEPAALRTLNDELKKRFAELSNR